MLNYGRKRRLRYINNYANQLTRGSVEQFNAENILSVYSFIVVTDGEPIHPRSNDAEFSSMCDFPEKDIKLPKWSCVLNWCSECPGVSVLDS